MSTLSPTPPTAGVPTRRTRALALLAPFVLYLTLVALLDDWIIDDAGISYAYARNVASGFGFVSQPGRPPVEGFSNFLWVLLLVPSFVVHAFHPVLLPKALGALTVLLAFGVLQRTLRKNTGGEAAGLVTTLLLAASPPIVIWTSSGLENGLILLLVAGIYEGLTDRPAGWQARCGALTALLAMTRPEGALYLAIGALACAADVVTKRATAGSAARSLAGYAGVFAAIFAPFMAFRLTVFGLPFPQTYYAKRMYPSMWARFVALADQGGALREKLAALCRAIAGPPGPWIVLLGLAGLAYLVWRGRLARHVQTAAVIQAVAIGAYLWLDDDWMGEYRFATVVIAGSILTLVTVAETLVHELTAADRRHAAAVAALAGCLALALDDVPRIVRFAQAAPTPYRDVERQLARRFDAYADILGASGGPSTSILVADVGAMLHTSKLRVYDLAGLCEPDVIRTLKRGKEVWLFDHPEFDAWVFETIKPTFVSSHRFWTYVSRLEQDPRFARDYVAIDEIDDLYLRDTFHVTLHSGDYVRRDALKTPADLDRLRSEYHALPRPTPLVYRIEDALDSRSRSPHQPRPSAALQKAGLDALYRERAPDPHRAAELFSRATQAQPRDVELAAQLANALDTAQRLDEARPVWGRVLALAEAPELASYATRARARLGLRAMPGEDVNRLMHDGTEALYQRQDPALAAALFRRVLAQSPEHFGATYQLAVALEADGRAALAQPLWTKALGLAELFGDDAAAGAARAKIKPQR